MLEFWRLSVPLLSLDSVELNESFSFFLSSFLDPLLLRAGLWNFDPETDGEASVLLVHSE